MERERSLEVISDKIYHVLENSIANIWWLSEKRELRGIRINSLFRISGSNILNIKVKNGRLNTKFNFKRINVYSLELFHLYLNTIIKLINSIIGEGMDYKFWYIDDISNPHRKNTPDEIEFGFIMLGDFNNEDQKYNK